MQTTTTVVRQRPTYSLLDCNEIIRYYFKGHNAVYRKMYFFGLFSDYITTSVVCARGRCFNRITYQYTITITTVLTRNDFCCCRRDLTAALLCDCRKFRHNFLGARARDESTGQYLISNNIIGTIKYNTTMIIMVTSTRGTARRIVYTHVTTRRNLQPVIITLRLTFVAAASRVRGPGTNMYLMRAEITWWRCHYIAAIRFRFPRAV